MTCHSRKYRSLAAALLLLPALAQAHPGHAGDAGFMAGVLHPFSGMAHLLELIVAGALLGWLPGRIRWLAGAAFLGLFGVTHDLWVEPAAAGEQFAAGLMFTSASLIAAGMAATRLVTRLVTAVAARSRILAASAAPASRPRASR